MGRIKDALCQLDKSHMKELEDAIIEEVRNPKFICKKCIRVATNKELLCKPKRVNSE